MRALCPASYTLPEGPAGVRAMRMNAKLGEELNFINLSALFCSAGKTLRRGTDRWKGRIHNWDYSACGNLGQYPVGCPQKIQWEKETSKH